MNFIFHFIYGISSFPLNNIFKDGYCTTNHIFIELDDGKIYRKALYLMVKTMVSG